MIQKYAYIIGSGSIACRHSRILKDFNYKPICVTNRIDRLNKLYHKNNFLKIMRLNDILFSENDIFIIANNTAQHNSACNALLKLGVCASTIYCEKPGPSDFKEICLLYNLEFLNLPHNNFGKLVKVVHKANATKWPSDILWKDRYVFRKLYGGGALLTHSHELHHASKKVKSNALKIESIKYFRDKDGNNVDKYVSGLVSNVYFELGIMEENPIRFWEYENTILHFYGNVAATGHSKNVITIENNIIEQSYIDMWRELLVNKLKINDYNWISEYV